MKTLEELMAASLKRKGEMLLMKQLFKEYDLSAEELAEVFVGSAYATTALESLKEQLWLTAHKHKSNPKFQQSRQHLIASLLTETMAPIEFLTRYLGAGENKTLKNIATVFQSLTGEAISCINGANKTKQVAFLKASLSLMQAHFLVEEKSQFTRGASDAHIGPRLYKAFDDIDSVFNLDYGLDSAMKIDSQQPERLYQGSGAGVQSGYSSILIAMNALKDKKVKSIIDLGSGYGRVGFVFALLSPEIAFTGYEYVPHRVVAANAITEHLGLSARLSFLAQDLSDFMLPEVDVYYMYDPFTKATYAYILHQILEIASRKKVFIVTKGNARSWLEDMAREHGWPEPWFYDKANLCVFQSRDV